MSDYKVLPIDQIETGDLISIVRNIRARINGYEMGNLADLRVARDEEPSEGLERSLQRNADQVQEMRDRLKPYVAELDRRNKAATDASS